VLDEGVVPLRLPVHAASIELLGIEPVRQVDAARRIDAQQRLGTRDEWCRRHDQHLASRRPRAHARGPGRGMTPAGWRALCDSLQHEQLSAMQVADDRHVGCDACRGGMQRGQVM
jgi:hypothetical protein